jgi:ribosomal protein S18 acetylase RimI-like enzyme
MALIRVAREEDCSECECLSRIEELKTATGNFLGKDYFKCFIDDDELFLVAEEEGSVVGYILGEPMKGRVAHIGMFTVSESHRGRGIGKMLVERFRKRCDEKGIRFIILYASENEKTIEFYRHRGFIEGKEYVHFLDMRNK